MLVKTISHRTVFGEKDKVLKLAMSDQTKEHFLYRLFGFVDGYSRGKGRFQRVNKETNLAEDTFWTKFSGEFQAVNSDGEVFEASTAFIPDYVSGQFVTTLDNDGEAEIQFAYDIFVIYSKTSATSYEYLAVPVRKSGDENKVASMAAALPALPGKTVPKLEAPKEKK